MKVTIVGAGYVGLTTGAVLAFLGHQVTLLDKNKAIISALQQGEIPIYEHGLDELMQLCRGRVSFTSSFSGIDQSEIVFIAVGTPAKDDGDADLSFLESAIMDLAMNLRGNNYPLVVNKSTVPPGTAYRVKTLVNNYIAANELPRGVSVASNPEFLREGNALFDALYPDRIVLGAAEDADFKLLECLYQPICKQQFSPPDFLPRPKGYSTPVIFKTDPISSELIKYAANAFLAIKISFINEFAGLAELFNADIVEIARGMGLDRRIGSKYLDAGVGWGGSCFGKDIKAIDYAAGQYGYALPLVKSSIVVNLRQRKLIVAKLRAALKTIPGSTIGILGLSFKPDTDDIRDTPASDVITELLGLGAFIKVYDPRAMDNYKNQYPNLDLAYASNLVELAAGCDALVLLTEWDEFNGADWEKVGQLMKNNVLVDGRNILDPVKMRDWGFNYCGIGRRLGLGISELGER